MPLRAWQLRAWICLNAPTAAWVCMAGAMAVMHEYMREKTARQQFLVVTLALERALRAQATAEEHRRATIEGAERFEKTIGYICESICSSCGRRGGGATGAASVMTSSCGFDSTCTEKSDS